MTRVYSYTAYGLCLSSSIKLPNFPVTGEFSEADICVRLGAEQLDYRDFDHVFELNYTTAPLSTGVNFEPVDVDLQKVAYRISYWGRVEFVVFDSGAQIRMSYPAAANFDDIVAILSGPVLGFAMRLSGIFCIHASVVAIDGYAVALVAPSGGGKSTTAAALAARGHSIISDDVLALRIDEDCVMAQPGFPWLRLCNDATEVLRKSGSRVATRLHGDKLFVQLPQPGYLRTQVPLPLVAMYTMISISDEVSITSIPAVQALMVLLRNTYPGPSYRLHKTNRVEELFRAKQVLQQVGARGVNYPRRLDKLTELCEALERDMRSQICLHSPQEPNVCMPPA